MDFAQALSLLKSTKENIPNHSEVDKSWADDYHRILATVEEQTADDLSAFRIPESELHHPVISARRGFIRHGQRIPGQAQRANNRMVLARTRLMQKLDALLEYLYRYDNADAPQKAAIGFKAGQ